MFIWLELIAATIKPAVTFTRNGTPTRPQHKSQPFGFAGASANGCGSDVTHSRQSQTEAKSFFLSFSDFVFIGRRRQKLSTEIIQRQIQCQFGFSLSLRTHTVDDCRPRDRAESGRHNPKQPKVDIMFATCFFWSFISVSFVIWLVGRTERKISKHRHGVPLSQTRWYVCSWCLRCFHVELEREEDGGGGSVVWWFSVFRSVCFCYLLLICRWRCSQTK